MVYYLWNPLFDTLVNKLEGSITGIVYGTIVFAVHFCSRLINDVGADKIREVPLKSLSPGSFPSTKKE